MRSNEEISPARLAGRAGAVGKSVTSLNMIHEVQEHQMLLNKSQSSIDTAAKYHYMSKEQIPNESSQNQLSQ